MKYIETFNKLYTALKVKYPGCIIEFKETIRGIKISCMFTYNNITRKFGGYFPYDKINDTHEIAVATRDTIKFAAFVKSQMRANKNNYYNYLT